MCLAPICRPCFGAHRPQGPLRSVLRKYGSWPLLRGASTLARQKVDSDRSDSFRYSCQAPFIVVSILGQHGPHRRDLFRCSTPWHMHSAPHTSPTVAFVGVPENMQKDWEKHAFSAGCVSNRRAECVTRERNSDRKRQNHPTQTERQR